MKNKVMTLIIVGLLTVGGISVVYAESKTNTTSNDFHKTMMGIQNGGTQSDGSYINMIKIMKNNGFSDEAVAMENNDSVAMNKLVANISDKEYKKMIEIMQKTGYASMAKMMQSVNREDMTKVHENMMKR